MFSRQPEFWGRRPGENPSFLTAAHSKIQRSIKTRGLRHSSDWAQAWAWPRPWPISSVGTCTFLKRPFVFWFLSRQRPLTASRFRISTDWMDDCLTLFKKRGFLLDENAYSSLFAENVCSRFLNSYIQSFSKYLLLPLNWANFRFHWLFAARNAVRAA